MKYISLILMLFVPLTSNADATLDLQLINAAGTGGIKTVEKLLNAGARVNSNSSLALIKAAENGNYGVVRLLLDNGAQVHARQDEPLRFAAIKGHTYVVDLLLQYGANTHALDDQALRFAAKNGHAEVVKLLLKHGANIHAYNDDALEWAAYNGHIKVVALLLEAGADVNNSAAPYYAIKYNHLEVVRLLEEARWYNKYKVIPIVAIILMISFLYFYSDVICEFKRKLTAKSKKAKALGKKQRGKKK